VKHAIFVALQYAIRNFSYYFLYIKNLIQNDLLPLAFRKMGDAYPEMYLSYIIE
jgi:hypothetical protein